MAKSKSVLVAESLDRVTGVAKGGVLRSEDMSRTDRERLQDAGYLQAVIKGWYLLVTPGVDPGESTPWFASSWDFLSSYLESRFDDAYCLGAEASLGLHLGATVLPRQVTAITVKGGQSVLELPHGCSLLMYQDPKNLPDAEDVVLIRESIRVMSLPMCLARLSPTYFELHSDKVDLALRMIHDGSDLSRVLVKGGYLAAAERVVGAYRHLGLMPMAEVIRSDVEAAGFSLNIENPFEPVYVSPLQERMITSPYPARLRAMWHAMREKIVNEFPSPPGLPDTPNDYIQNLDEIYDNDAYNSLSIEGYRVTPEMIERMRSGEWHPEENPEDRSLADALAANGYNRAFNLVKECIDRILKGEPAGLLVAEYIHNWYRALFSAQVEAGLVGEHDLIGYRRQQIFIRGSMHVPPPADAMSDCMTAYLGLIYEEPEPCVRVVLGHFMLVYIHPYIDGNGRLARFLMNAMLASGGYPWTVTPLSKRKAYMTSLESASVDGDILPFTRFVARMVEGA